MYWLFVCLRSIDLSAGIDILASTHICGRKLLPVYVPHTSLAQEIVLQRAALEGVTVLKLEWKGVAPGDPICCPERERELLAALAPLMADPTAEPAKTLLAAETTLPDRDMVRTLLLSSKPAWSSGDEELGINLYGWIFILFEVGAVPGTWLSKTRTVTRPYSSTPPPTTSARAPFNSGRRLIPETITGSPGMGTLKEPCSPWSCACDMLVRVNSCWALLYISFVVMRLQISSSFAGSHMLKTRRRSTRGKNSAHRPRSTVGKLETGLP